MTTASRAARALALRKEGKTYRQIAAEIGYADDPSRPLSIGRVRELVKNQKREEEFLEEAGDLAPLGWRICRTILHVGFKCLADLAGADAHLLTKANAGRSCNYYGNMLGRKSLDLIDNLLFQNGLPPLARNRSDRAAASIAARAFHLRERPLSRSGVHLTPERQASILEALAQGRIVEAQQIILDIISEEWDQNEAMKEKSAAPASRGNGSNKECFA